jgi:uncharacterized membrane protein
LVIALPESLALVVCADGTARHTRIASPRAIFFIIIAHFIILIMLIFIALEQRISEHKKAPFGASASYEF